ncbi:hypothetical protein TNCV_785701 [Trichonephila clavipes]|nr:hypothetical protein TNCV_785701 [Trichonephila clavipes]
MILARCWQQWITKDYQVIRPFTTRPHLDVLGRQLKSSRNIGELTAHLQRLYNLQQEVIGDLSDLMPPRVSACAAATVGFTFY